MRFHRFLWAALAGVLALATLSTPADAAESYARLLNGESFRGDVPAGAAVRLEFALAAGTEPRFTLTLAASAGPTISFQEMKLFGPDGKEVPFDPTFLSLSIKQSLGRYTLTFRRFVAPQSGVYQFLIKTNARVLAHVTGKFAVARPTKIPFQGDETSVAPANPVTVSLLTSGGNGDSVTLSVKRRSGTAPKIVAFSSPIGNSTQFPQKTTKKGTSTRQPIYATQSGDYAFTIGYQAGAAVGAWKGTLKVKPFKVRAGSYPHPLQLRNSPGVGLSVFDNDRNLAPSFGGSGIGVAADANLNNNVILVTSEGGGSLYGQFFDADLAAIPGQTTPTQLMTPSDFSTGEAMSGHRTMFVGGFYYVAASTASGRGLSIVQANGALQVGHRTQVLNASADSTKDFFMVSDGTSVSLGVAHPATSGHAVYVLNGATLGLANTVSIGGPTLPQSAGGGAAWRGAADSVFELWTPDTLDFHGPSDLHRVLYSAAWASTTADAKPVNVPTDVETMPTAVVVDVATGVTIVHYVVADNPPVGQPGTGYIHRRLFDPSGVEVPDSHVVLPRASCNRPTSTIRGNYLYVAYESSAGPRVDRYQLLR